MRQRELTEGCEIKQSSSKYSGDLDYSLEQQLSHICEGCHMY